MPDMTSSQLPPLTFDDATRQNIVPLSSFSYSPGGTVVFSLPTSGLGARLYLACTGTVTNTPTLTTTGPWSLIARITVKANNGVAILDVSGYGLYLLMITSNPTFDPGSFPLTQGSTAGNRNTLFNFTNAVINFALEIPLAWNRRDDIGLVMLQNQRAQVTVQIVFAAAAGAATPIQSGPYIGATAVVTATFAPFLEFFTLPTSPSLFPNLLILCSRLETTQAIAASGDQLVTLNRGNTYSKLIHWCVNNNVLDTTDFTRQTLRYDQNVRPYEITLQTLLLLQEMWYRRVLPDGTFMWDLEWQGAPGLGYFRDTIDSEAVSELTSILNFGVSPTSPANINTIAEQLVHLEQPQQAA